MKAFTYDPETQSGFIELEYLFDKYMEDGERLHNGKLFQFDEGNVIYFVSITEINPEESEVWFQIYWPN